VAKDVEPLQGSAIVNCWHCQTELIWGGDHDCEEDDGIVYFMVTNLHCPNCACQVLVYLPTDESDLHPDNGDVGGVDIKITSIH